LFKFWGTFSFFPLMIADLRGRNFLLNTIKNLAKIIAYYLSQSLPFLSSEKRLRNLTTLYDIFKIYAVNKP